MNAAEFLTALWGEQPPGWIACWRLENKASSYYNSPGAAGLVLPTEKDIYTGVSLAPADLGPKRRTPNAKAVAIAGLWADIDVNGGPDDKQGAAPNRDTAVELANVLAEPTILVDSGYGVQAWWLFEGGAWRFRTYGEQRLGARAAAQWQKLLRERADGFGMDYTHDLARILRLPGTLNGKGGERAPVRILAEGPRHERDELFEIAGHAGDVDPGYSIGERRSVTVSCRPDTTPPKLANLVNRSPAFRRTWRHERDELPSMSEHDMALVSIAALAGWSDQELADLIVCHRQTRDKSDPKASRIDYIKRTIARVREQAPAVEGPREPAAAKGGRPGTLTREQWADLLGAHLEAADDHVIPVPFRGLRDPLDGGLRPGQVCLVAGYTSHGKSVVVDQLADHAALSGSRVHLYLTEMTAYARGLRLLARMTRVPFGKLKRRELDADQWTRVVKQLNDLPYGVSIVSDWTVEDVVADIRENHWDVAVVDLIHGFHYADERDLSKSSSAIVRAAKGSATDDHPGTAIICAAHLNDGQMRDSRSNRRPRPGLHSLKGSSSLKQDADVVMFIWREDNEQGFPDPEGALWVAKNRDGGLGGVDVIFDAVRMEFNEAATLMVAA